MGCAPICISTQLKKRVEHGIFLIEPDEDNASSHRYPLTERGKELYIVIMALCQWGENGCFAPDEKRYLMIDRKQGRPLAPLELRADRSEERRVGKEGAVCVDLGGRRIIKKKKTQERENKRK